MKDLVALYAETPLHHTMIRRLLDMYGERYSTVLKGDYYIHNSDTNTWTQTNDIIGMQIINAFDVKEFLDKYGYEKPLGVGEWLETLPL